MVLSNHPPSSSSSTPPTPTPLSQTASRSSSANSMSTAISTSTFGSASSTTSPLTLQPNSNSHSHSSTSLTLAQLAQRTRSLLPSFMLPTSSISSNLPTPEVIVTPPLPMNLPANAVLPLPLPPPASPPIISPPTPQPQPTPAKTTIVETHLTGQEIYVCQSCCTHLSTHDDLISKSFHSHSGRAYLFDSAVNVTYGDAEDRMLITGMHRVIDIMCAGEGCGVTVGWSYLKAYESAQKYKEGKFILEKCRIMISEGEEESTSSSNSNSNGFNDGRSAKRRNAWQGGEVYELERRNDSDHRDDED